MACMWAISVVFPSPSHNTTDNKASAWHSSPSSSSILHHVYILTPIDTELLLDSSQSCPWHQHTKLKAMKRIPYTSHEHFRTVASLYIIPNFAVRLGSALVWPWNQQQHLKLHWASTWKLLINYNLRLELIKCRALWRSTHGVIFSVLLDFPFGLLLRL